MGLFTSLNRPVTHWNGQRVWIIGASSGIGAALAQHMLAQGALVVLSARRLDMLHHVAQQHTAAHIVALDALDEAAWPAAWQEIETSLGGIDYVIFCAAEYRPERSWEVDPTTALRTLKINLASVYNGLALVLPGMLARKQGGIALVASVAGYMGLPNASVYGPSKAALINLAEILYTDLHPRGINVHVINPGFVDTGLTQKNKFYMPALQTTEQAAISILQGFAQGLFEIHFPRSFTRVLKLIQMLPYRLRFSVMKRLIP